MPRKRKRRQYKLKPGRPGKFTAQQVADALVATHGIKILAARLLECNRQTISNYIKRYVKVKVAYDEATDVILDIAEGNVFRAVVRGNLEESHWLLVKKGQRRGYSPMGSMDPEQAAYLKPALPAGVVEPEEAPFVLEISEETLAGALRRLQDAGVIIDTEEYEVLPSGQENGNQ